MPEKRVCLTNPTKGKGIMIFGGLEQIVGVGCLGVGAFNFLKYSGSQQDSAETMMMFGLANIVIGQVIYRIGKLVHWYYND